MSSTISNSNYYSVSASSNNGISGLISGMDTDSMVKQMLSGTQSKIDSKNQEKQQLEWKQEQYHEVIDAINSFSSKYFDSSYDSSLATNLSNADLFNSMISTVTGGNSVKLVSTGSSASTGTTTIKVNKLASATKLQTGKKISNDIIVGTGIKTDELISHLKEGESFSIDLTLDGVKKTVTLEADDFGDKLESLTANDIADALKSKTAKVFGDYVSLENTDGKLTFKLGGKIGNEQGHELNITGADAKYIGIDPGSSTQVSGATKLGSLTNISGDVFKFSINGTDFEFDSNTSISKMMNTINSSDAGVRMTYSSLTDKFSLEQTSMGEGYGIDVKQETGNLMSVIFGSENVSAGTGTASAKLNTQTVNGKALANNFTTAAASMKMEVNGASYTFSLAKKANGVEYTKTEIEEKLNEWLGETFGKTGETANISYADGKLKTAQGYSVSFAKTAVDTNSPSEFAAAAKKDLAIAFGFSQKNAGASNAVTGDTLVSEIDALAGYVDAGTKLSELKSINVNGQEIEASYADGRIMLKTAGAYDFGGTGLENVFGAGIEIGTGEMTEGVVDKGTDAQVIINGVATTRSSNTFTVDGITLTATSVDEGDSQTVIGTVRDTDKIVNTIKSFVDDYNTLIKDLYGRVTQDAEYRSYKPLTTAQEDEMTEKQVELWEEKAKTGLLRNDTDINSLIDAMRSAVYTSAGDSGLALFSIGIESKSWNGAGELTIDENMLRSAVESNPEGVSALFADKTSGVAATLSAACDAAAKISLSNTGSLVTKAGAKDWSAGNKTNDIYFDLKRIDDRLDYLNKLYQTQKTRYWNQFSSMEAIMSQYNSQSAMISNMFG